MLPSLLVAPAAPPAAASDDSASAECTVRRLEHLPGETRSEVTGGSPSGRWVVGSVEVGFSLHTVRWSGRHLKEIPVEMPGSWLTDVNGAGDVTGTGTGSSSFEGFAVLDGEYTSLESPDGAYGTYPVAISGDRIAGHSELDDGTVRPFVWLFDQPEDAVPLPLPAGHSGFVVGMTPHGRVVVAATRVSRPDRAFVFSRSLQRRELVAPDGVGEFVVSAAARGIAAGYVPGGSTALRFDLHSGEATAVATKVMPSVVTPGGVLGGTDLSDRPALVIGSRTKHLPNLGFDGFASIGAITPEGRPYGMVPRGDTYAAVRWTCG